MTETMFVEKNTALACETEKITTLENSMPTIISDMLFVLPDQIKLLKGEIIEICMLDEKFIEELLNHATMEIGHYLEPLFDGHFNSPFKYTLRDLFLYTIINEDISFRDKMSYDILDKLIAKKNTSDSSFFVMEKPTEIRLSSLMCHRFDGDEYSFSEKNISKLIMKSNNISFFRRVVRMMRYLFRKKVLYIDYPQYYEFVNGKQLVLPLPLDQLHRTSTKNCTYYSNFWEGADEHKSEHSNAVMSILSFIKYCVERNKT